MWSIVFLALYYSLDYSFLASLAQIKTLSWGVSLRIWTCRSVRVNTLFAQISNSSLVRKMRLLRMWDICVVQIASFAPHLFTYLHWLCIYSNLLMQIFKWSFVVYAPLFIIKEINILLNDLYILYNSIASGSFICSCDKLRFKFYYLYSFKRAFMHDACAFIYLQVTPAGWCVWRTPRAPSPLSWVTCPCRSCPACWWPWTGWKSPRPMPPLPPLKRPRPRANPASFSAPIQVRRAIMPICPTYTRICEERLSQSLTKKYTKLLYATHVL